MITPERRRAYEQMFVSQVQEWERIAATRDGRGDPISLAARSDAFKKKLEELRKASDDGWEKLKGDVENAWAEIKILIPREP